MRPRPLSINRRRMGFANPRAEEIRLRALYRRFAMSALKPASTEALRGLVGPDCAYHLYGGCGRGGR